MYDNAHPSDIVTFLQRIDPTVLPGRTSHDAWLEFLKKNNGGSGTMTTMEANWLNSKGANGSGGSHHDQVNMYLGSKGFAGTKNDRIRAYLLGSATQ